MNLDDNFASISGVIIEKSEIGFIVQSFRKSDKENLIWVWGLPSELKVGTCVNVIGELEARPVYRGCTKNILGIKAYCHFIEDVSPEKYVAFDDFACVSGEIVWYSDLRLTPKNRSRIFEFKILMKNDVFVRIIAWNGLAEKIFREFKLGDKIEIEGILCSRKYLKQDQDGCMIEKITTEINAQKIRIA